MQKITPLQVVPTLLGKLLSDPDPAKTQRVMQTMLQMKKLNIAKLKKAYEQRKEEKAA